MKKTFKNKLTYILGIIALAIILNFSITQAAPDSELTYHGKLTDTNNVAVSDGDYDFTLTIYDAESGGTCLWTSRGTCGTPTSKTLTITNGIFSTTLGESGDNVLDITFDSNYYLGVTINSNSEMTPRRKITPTGFALNSHRFNGQTEDYYLNTSNSIQNKTGGLTLGDDFTVNSNDFFVDTVNGRVGIGTDSPNAMLDVRGSAIFNEEGGDNNFRIEGENILNLFSIDASYDSIGIAVNPPIANTLDIGETYPDVIASGTNHYKVVDITGYDLPIAAGVLDSGYRIGLGVQGFTNDSNFQGALNEQYGIWSRVGSNTINPTGTITNSYAIFLDNLDGGANVINKYGVYQKNSTAKNYFAGSIGIGTMVPNSKLEVESAYSGSTMKNQIGNGTFAFQEIYSNSSTDDGNVPYLSFHRGGQTAWQQGLLGNDFVITRGGGASTTDLFSSSLFTILNSNGNIGIGTNTPTNFKLQVAGHIGPDADDTYDLGSSTNRFRDLYLGPNSLHIGENGNEGIISYDTINEAFNFDKAAVFGTSTNAVAGMIRWSGTDLEGYDGSVWNSLTSSGGTSTYTGLTDTPASLSANQIQFTNSAGNAITQNSNFTYDGNNLAIGGSITLNNDASACDVTKEGAMRYNDTSKVMEFCNGTIWGGLSTGTSGSGVTQTQVTLAQGESTTVSGSAIVSITEEQTETDKIQNINYNSEDNYTQEDLKENITQFQVDLVDTGGGTGPDLATGGAVTSSAHHASYPPSRAFDDNTSTQWLSTPGGAAQIQYDLGSGNEAIVSEYSVRSTSVTRAPKDWTFEGSNDANTWTALDVRSAEMGWIANEKRNYSGFINDTAYRYFRLNITANNGDASYTDISELEFFADQHNNKGHFEDVSDTAVSIGSGNTADKVRVGSRFKMEDAWFTITDVTGDGTANESVHITNDNEIELGIYDVDNIYGTYFDGSNAAHTLGQATSVKYVSDIATGGAATASSAYATYVPSRAFDDNTSTQWLSTPGGAAHIQYDLGSGNEAIVYEYSVQGITVARLPKDWTFEGSNDANTWTVLDVRSAEMNWLSNEKRNYSGFTNNTAYRYYRLNITANNGDASYTDISEMTFYEKTLGNYTGAYVTTITNQDGLDSANWTDINSVSVLENLNSQSIFYGVSFNNRHTFKVWTGSAWRYIASKEASVHGGTDGTWYFRDNVDTWSTVGIEDNANSAISKAVESGVMNQMNSTTLESISDADWESSGSFAIDQTTFDLSSTFYSTSDTQNPNLKRIDVSVDATGYAQKNVTDDYTVYQTTGLGDQTLTIVKKSPGTQTVTISSSSAGSSGGTSGINHIFTTAEIWNALDSLDGTEAMSVMIDTTDMTQGHIEIIEDGITIEYIDPKDKITRVIAPNTTLDIKSVATGYDLSTMSFVDATSLTAQDTTVLDIEFNNDGTKLFILGGVGDDINEYTLSTPYDASTITFVDSFSVATQEISPTGFTFNPDGTSMYVIGTTGDDVNQYTLSTAFDVSTATYTDRFSVATEDTGPDDVIFNNDGTKMFVVGSTGIDVGEYTLSTPFDVTTAAFIQQSSVSVEEANPNGIEFSPGGKRMYIVGQNGDEINEYSLARPFDIDSEGHIGTYSLSAQEGVVSGIAFNNDGTKVFIVGSSGDDINEYTLAASVFTGTAHVTVGSSGSSSSSSSLWTANGSDAYYDTGNIGIGTTTPDNFTLQVAGHIGPDTDDTYDLGSSTNRFRDLYLGPSSLHIGEDGNEAVISYNTISNEIEFSTPINLTGSITLTNDTDACDVNKEGAMRYNDTTKVMEFCNGTQWGAFATGSSSGTSIIPHSFVQYDNIDRSFTTAITDGKTWDTVTIRDGFDVDLDYNIPARNASTSWGGGYLYLEYSLNGGAWTAIGNSGYQLAMSNGATDIETHSGMIRMTRAELGSVTGDFDIQFKFRHKSYDGTLLINGSRGTTDEKFSTRVRISEVTSDDSSIVSAGVSSSGGGGIKSIQTFDIAGAHTWTKPAGIETIRVQVIGGGGGGKAYEENYGGGGGSGAGYAEKIIDVSSITSVPVTVGAGGVVNTSGTDTSFDTHVSATGGGKGNRLAVSDAPGSGVGGDINNTGSRGKELSNYQACPAGDGGLSFLGFENAKSAQNGKNAETSIGYGSGGGGGCYDGSTIRSASAGSDGVVIIYEYAGSSESSSLPTCTDGQTLSYNEASSDWECADGVVGNTSSFSINKNTVDQSIPSSTNTLVTWDAEEFDTNNDFDLTTEQFTPTVQGKYLLTFTTRWENLNDSDITQVYIYKNGSVVTGDYGYLTGTYRTNKISVVVDANGTTDYFEVRAYHDNAANKNMSGGYWTNFSGSLIGGGSSSISGGGQTWNLMHVQDQKVTNTAPQTITTGENQLQLNTVMTNEIAGASLASNQITLPAGDYYLEGTGLSFRTGSLGKTRLEIQKIDNTFLAASTTYADYDNATVTGKVTFTEETIIDFLLYTDNIAAQGRSSNRNPYEIYTDLKIWKIEESSGSSSSSYTPGFLYGFNLSNDSGDTDHDVYVSSGYAKDETDLKDLELATGLTKQLDASFSEGDDQGGLFSGTIANDTMYYVFLIEKDDGTTDIGFDTDINATNIPSGFTSYRWLGYVVTDSSSNIEQFIMKGDTIYFAKDTGPLFTTSMSTTWNYPNYSNIIPVTRAETVLFGGTNGYLRISYDSTPSANGFAYELFTANSNTNYGNKTGFHPVEKTQVKADSAGLSVGVKAVELDRGSTSGGSTNSPWTQTGNNIAYTSGNVGIGSSNYGTTADNILTISNSIAPTTSIVNGIQLFAVDQSGSHELRVRDEAGNTTTLSPHNFSTIPGGESEELAWSYYSEKDNKSINVDMTKTVRLIEKLTGQQLIYITDITTGQEVPNLNLIDISNLPTPQKITEIDTQIIDLNDKQLGLSLQTNDASEILNQVQDDIGGINDRHEVLSLQINANTLATETLTEIEDRMDELDGYQSDLASTVSKNSDTVLAINERFLFTIDNNTMSTTRLITTIEGLTVLDDLKVNSIETNTLNINDDITTHDEQGNEINASSIGTATIVAGETEVIVETESINVNSRVFVSPKIPLEQTLAAEDIIDGKSFVVKLLEERLEDLKVDWFIIN
ncbi:MAG: discoidin domain-containing protein [Candidatus Moraniibacteriota bacterium]